MIYGEKLQFQFKLRYNEKGEVLGTRDLTVNIPDGWVLGPIPRPMDIPNVDPNGREPQICPPFEKEAHFKVKGGVIVEPISKGAPKLSSAK